MWIVDMTLDGLKVSTRKKYFGRIHSTYREWKSVPGENPFEAAKNAVELEFRCDNPEANRNLGLIDKLLYRAKDTFSKEHVNLFLYLLYNPMSTMSDAVNLKFDDYGVESPQIDEIIDEQKELNGRSSNVFALGRGHKRETQITREALQELSTIAQSLGMRFGSTFSRDSITAIWIAAALKAGVSVAEVRSIIPAVPPQYVALCMVPIIALTDARKREIIRKVADSVNNKPPEWFVMKMRSGQNPDTIKDKIRMTTEGILDTMTFYYPTHKVRQQNSKGKTVNKEVPYIPGVLFFRTGRNVVPQLMSRIGEVAWCYKYSNTAGSKYCTISRNEMRAFQRYIGEFTPDVEIGLEVRETPLEKGTIVRISGGKRMAGEEAVIEAVKNINGTRTYTLSLTNYLQAKWTIKDMEEIYIDPVSK